MLKYRESNLVRAGVIGVVVILLIIAVGLQPDRLIALATSVRHGALFAEAGGLQPGDDVRMSGMVIGSVEEVSLEHGNALVSFTIQSKYPLGSETTAHIRTKTLLGQRMITLESAGSGTLGRTDVIPVSRTSSPYSLNDAISELTVNTAGTDTEGLNQSLDTLADTIDQISPQLGPTFDSLTRLSQSLNSRNETLSELLKSAGDVTGILAQRSEQLNMLILNANSLIGVLNERRESIVQLLASTSAMATELSGLVADNELQLKPALEQLNSVTAVLEKNRDNIATMLPRLAKYQLTQGETVSGGFYYTAYLANLTPSQVLQPFLDYAFGFRRGVDAGQPPDNAGPRAELGEGVPFNQLPGGSR